jgi:uncharacterized membrane protein YoaK (UPF0700 family)
MGAALPILLSLSGGFADTAGFLALQGLFTAHVTGNFVTLGASLVLGTSGAAAKLLALPTFWIVVLATRLVSYSLSGRDLPVLRTMLTLKVGLLLAAASLAVCFGPFKTGDDWPGIATGMTLVGAMAIQNAAHRIHLSAAPPTTLMTGTTTQMMIDLADLFMRPATEIAEARRSRLIRMSRGVGAFAFGCGASALLFAWVGVWCFTAPPVIGLCSLALPMRAYKGDIE